MQVSAHHRAREQSHTRVVIYSRVHAHPVNVGQQDPLIFNWSAVVLGKRKRVLARSHAEPGQGRQHTFVEVRPEVAAIRVDRSLAILQSRVILKHVLYVLMHHTQQHALNHAEAEARRKHTVARQHQAQVVVGARDRRLHMKL